MAERLNNEINEDNEKINIFQQKINEFLSAH